MKSLQGFSFAKTAVETSIGKSKEISKKKKKGLSTLGSFLVISKSLKDIEKKKIDLDGYEELTDSELVSIIQTKDIEAYQILFYRYRKKLLVYIAHLIGNIDEAEDVLQNVFSKTYKNINDFDTSRKFSSWIYRIAHNEAVNYLKRKSKRYTVSWEDITASKDKLDTASNDKCPEDEWLRQEIVRQIDDALEKLPNKYQQILRMRYFDEHSYDYIGKVLGKPVNTVGTLINRAKRKLLEVIKNENVRDVIICMFFLEMSLFFICLSGA